MLDLVPLGLLVLAVALVGAAVARSRVVVGPDEAAVVFRLGRTDPGNVLRTGTHVVVPIVDRPVMVRLGPIATDVSTAGTTSDGANVRVEVSLSWRVVDPYRSVVNVIDVEAGVTQMVGTAAREATRATTRADALADPDALARTVAARLTEVFERWGLAIDSITARVGPAA